jgi:restriction system protein
MGRSRGFVSTLIRMERAGRRAQAAQARATVRAQRQAQRAGERYRVAEAKEQKRIYIESRLAEVEDQNVELEQTVAALASVLQDALTKDCSLDLDTLKEPLSDEPFLPGGLAHALPAPELDQYLPPPPGRVMRLLPGVQSKHERRTAEARQRFETDVAAHAEAERQRQQRLEEARAAHAAKVAENRRRVEEQHAEVEELKRGFQARSAEAVAEYFTLVLDRSEYPEGFPGSSEVTYEPGSRRLVVDLELPSFDIVPEVGSFRYVKAKDEITESPRSGKDRRGLYASVIAQTALRTLHEVFSADKAWQTVDTVVFSGYVNGIDRGTGRPARPCLVSVRTSPDLSTSFDLQHVDPAACLRALHAALSKSPEELIPVEPVFGLNVVDSRLKKK